MVLDKILRAGEGKLLRKLSRIADQVNAIEADFVAMSDDELRAMTDEFRRRLADGETLDDLLPEAFATVREAAKRTLGQRHFDVQLMGGAALHLGNIAEMRTGEGKTLVSTLPVYLNALEEKGVHLVTVNDYLAKRDSEWMGRVHRFLGLTVGVIVAQMTPEQRRAAYACDVTYGTNNEFGFDYLRDNMAWSADEMVQRGHHFAIVDEVDSILIDEARTPLIISGPADQPTKWYVDFARVVQRLQRGEEGEGDYEVDESKKTVAVSEQGVEKVEDWLGIDNLYEAVNTPLVGFLNNAIKAKELFKRDKDYIVTGGADSEVLIVDEFTGRTLYGRRYNEGMHQAIEAKESVEIKQENQTLATITLQNFFRLYDKLAGMTGTALTEANEFSQTYKMGVVEIPTNMPMVRDDAKDIVYQTEPAKFAALVDDIAERNALGQPILVGTVSVEKSELLSDLLLRRGVPHEVLNAKYHEREAAIVAQAGRKGAVTVATNMAGRGTDIMLGGNPDFIADQELHAKGLSPVDTPEDYEAAWPEILARLQEQVKAEHDEVVGLGGLYVLGTERHESRRIDNQLRGRSGRQGDPGISRFYLSLGDDLMRLFNAAAVESIMGRLSLPEDVPIESKMVTRAIRSAQTQIEQQNHEIRKNVLKYDEVMNKQRQVSYDERRRVLHGEDLHEQVRHMIEDVVTDYVRQATTEGFEEDWDLDQLWTALRTLYPVSVSIEALEDETGGGMSAEFLESELTADALAAYDQRETELGEDADGEPVLREVERRVLLSVLDRKWREHLYEMDYLQEGISLRSYGQRDPLVEYQREAFDMFSTMMEGIKEESVGYLFHLEVQVAEPEADGQASDAAAVSAGQPATAELGPEPAPPAGAGVSLSVEAEAPAPPAGASAPVAGSEPTVSAGQSNGASPPPSTDGAPLQEASAGRQPGGAQRGDQPASGAPGGQDGDRAKADLGSAFGGPRRSGGLSYSAPTLDVEGGVQRSGSDAPGNGNGSADGGYEGTARNAPCPCGSGRKYKRCHGDPRNRTAVS